MPVAIWPDGCDYEQRGDDTTVGRLKVDGNGVCADEPADSDILLHCTAQISISILIGRRRRQQQQQQSATVWLGRA